MVPVDLTLGFRFGVYFLGAGAVPNALDIRFQKVSGLSAEVSLVTHQEGGENLYSHRIPDRVDYRNLVLERGMVIGSPLNVEFDVVLSHFQFLPSNVIVAVHGEEGAPRAAWMFINAFPVKWSTSDLDASAESVVIDTMELAYARMQPIRI